MKTRKFWSLLKIVSLAWVGLSAQFATADGFIPSTDIDWGTTFSFDAYPGVASSQFIPSLSYDMSTELKDHYSYDLTGCPSWLTVYAGNQGQLSSGLLPTTSSTALTRGKVNVVYGRFGRGADVAVAVVCDVNSGAERSYTFKMTRKIVYGSGADFRTARWTYTFKVTQKGAAVTTYTVKFNANGGTGNMSNQTISRDVSTALKANSFTKSGHTFAGWATSSSGSVVYADRASVKNLASAGGTITLYAKWTANSYPNFIFWSDKGWPESAFLTVSESSVTKKVEFVRGEVIYLRYGFGNNGTAAAPAAESVRLDYDGTPFDTTAGDSLLAVGSGRTRWVALNSGSMSVGSHTIRIVLNPDRTIAESSYEDNEKSVSFTIAAPPTTYTVKFNANGGTGSMADQTLTVGSIGTLKANAFANSGYAFAGWAITSSGVARYADKASVSDLASAGSSITLYAVWQLVPTTYTVKFNANGGSGSMSDQVISTGATVPLVPNAFSMAGHVFAGWAKTSTGNVAYADEARVKDLAAAGGAITLFAKWTPVGAQCPFPDAVVKPDTFILYARIYDKNGGTYLESSDGVLAAFAADGECRGKTTLSQGPNGKLFQLTVGIENSSEKGITLKYWSSETGAIDKMGVTYDGSQATRGAIANPLVIRIPPNDPCSITLNSGYTWVSANVMPEDTSFASVFKGVAFADQDVIKSSDGSATYYGGVWYPSNPAFVFTAGRAYAVKKSTAGSTTVEVVGTPAVASIDVGSGWNWIGPTAQATVGLSDMTHSAGFQNEDIINSSGDSATYYGQWYGTMTSLIPGHGYKAKFAKAGTLSFGAVQQNAFSSDAVFAAAAGASALPNWTPVTQPDTIIGYYSVKDAQSQTALETAGSKLGVFSESGECRGVAEITQGPKGKLFQITIGIASSSEKNLAFKIWDAGSGTTYDVNETIATVSGIETIGTIVAPATLTYTPALPPTTKYTVTFDLGTHGTRIGGGELSQQVESGKAATAPTVLVADGWEFTGWDKSFESVTADMAVTAQYAESGSKPDWIPVPQPDTIIGYYSVRNADTDALVESDGSLLAVFAADGECRGVTSIGQGPRGKLFQITIGIASSSDKNLTLKVWDAARDEVFDVNERIDSVAGVETIGTIIAPLTLTIGSQSAIYHTVFFDLGEHATRTGGGELTQSVESGKAATAPTFAVAAGWAFAGWDKSFDNVTASMTVTAQYKAVGEYGPWGDGSGIVNSDMCAPTYLEDMAVTVYGQPIAAGDVVAVYRTDTGALCGLGKATGADGTVTVVCYAPAGTKLHFAFWKSGSPTDDFVDAPKSSDITAVKPGSFVSGSKLVITDVIDLTLKLGSSESWHTVSFNVLPDDPSPASVFKEVADRIVAVNSSGVQYWMPGKGGSLSKVEIGAGYWVKARVDNVSWTVSGVPAPETEIAVKQGWNLIGYTPESADATATVLKSAFASGLLKNVTYGVSFYPGNLTTMMPGVGYWVYATKDGTLGYDAAAVQDDNMMESDAVRVLSNDEALPEYGPWGDGSDVVNSDMLAPTYFENLSVSIDGSALSPGDVVAAFRADTGALCGLGKAYDNSGLITLVCYAPEGTRLHFQVWQSTGGIVDPVLLDCDAESDMNAPRSGTFNDGLAVTVTTKSDPPDVTRPEWTPVTQPDTLIGYFSVKNANTGAFVETDGSLLGAFASNGECRGVTEIMQGPKGKLFQITIGIALSSETGLTLKIWDAGTGKTYDIEQTFDAGVEQYGSIADPEVLEINPMPSGFAFESTETWAEKDGAFVLTVYGGSDEAATSVKVNAAYGSAKAADLVLKQATVEGANGVEQKNLKFPLTLNWAKGDTAPKTITIPTTVGKASDAPKCLTWNLSDAKGLPLAEESYCIGTIGPGSDWTGKDVYVLPYVTDSTGGKVSGGASVKPDTQGKFKAVTLKATANKGYWFAGWYDAYGELVSGDLSYKVTPDGSDSLPKYEARFVPKQPSLCGTYNGYAKVNLKGMTLVKKADTSADVLGEYAFTVTLAKTGKVSGSVTVGGKKITLKGDAVYESGDGYVSALVMADEKACFGKANGETLSLYLDSDGMAGLSGYVETDDAFKPLGGDECWGVAWKVVSKDKDEAKKLEVFAGTYVGAALQADGGVVPVSIVVDKTGKAKLAGKYSDGTALTASGAMGGYKALDDGTETAELELVMTPKALGSGAYHLRVFASTDDTGVPSLQLNGYTTTYTKKTVKAVAYADSQMAYPFTSGCWVPEDADPDFGVVRLYSGEDLIDILYASQNGKITGLGKATATGYTVKFDKKTGLFTVTKGKEYTIQGVLGAYDCSCQAVGRINKDGTFESVGLEFTTLPEPQENFPWMADGFVLTLGQNYGEALQPSVWSDVAPVELTISGLPAGLKFDKKTGCITGAPTKDGSFAVKVSYAYGTQKITRTTTLVVAPKPEGLPTGTYAGYATVNVGIEEGKPVACPFTATIDKKGALSGSITIFGKKATLKASGYVDFYDDTATYVATLDLKAVDKKWGAVTLQLVVGADCVISSYSEEVFGDGFAVDSVCAWRNQSKDDDYAARVKPYVGNYVTALSAEIGEGGPSGVTTLSVSVDKKGNVKIAGTFVDGSAFSASTPLAVVEDEDGTSAQACVAVAPKSLGQGAMCVELDFSAPTGAEVAGLWCFAKAAKFVRTSGEYVEYGISTDFAYRYASLAWVDASVSAAETCLSVSCDNGSFDPAQFAWKMKNSVCGAEIVGVDKRLSGPTMTFKLDDKTGLFSGSCGTYKIFGAMQEGTCSGFGTVVGRDGSVGLVTVEVASR